MKAFTKIAGRHAGLRIALFAAGIFAASATPISSVWSQASDPWSAVAQPVPGRFDAQMGAANEQAWFVPGGLDSAGQPVLLPVRVLVPAGQGPFPLAIVSHGSPANAAARKSMTPPEYKAGTEWLLSKGYMVALPLRRGYGSRGGEWAEAYNTCAEPDYVKGGNGTADDILAVARYFAAQPNVRGSKILLVGQSAGGWGSLAAASRNPNGVFAVVNFAGGRGGYAGGKPNNNCVPDRLVEAAGQFGKGGRIPTLWIFTENDRFFDPALSRKMAEAYQSAGGKAEYHLLPAFDEDGHRLFPKAEGRTIWQPIVDQFLARVAPR